MMPALTNAFKNSNNFHQAILWWAGAIIYLVAGLVISIFTIIRACQSHFVDYCLLDSIIAINHRFTFFFVIAIPYLVTFYCTISNEFFYQIALRKTSRQNIWKLNIFSLFVISSTWTMLSLIVAIIITTPFATSINNWDVATSYFFSSTGMLLTPNFIAVLVVVFLGSWSTMFALGLVALIAYWRNDSIVQSTLVVLLLIGLSQVFQFPPVLISYDSILNPFKYGFSIVLVTIISGAGSVILRRSNLVIRKEFYE